MPTILPTGFLILVLALAGCATNPGVVKLDADTYTLYKEDHAGIFGNATQLRNDVINEANIFAESKGKIAYPVSAKTHHTTGRPADWETFEYRFRLVDKSDHAARKTYLLPESDVVTDEDGKVTGSIVNSAPAEKPKDHYTELIQLDDLRKRGIITDVEFEAGKKKLLGAN